MLRLFFFLTLLLLSNTAWSQSNRTPNTSGLTNDLNYTYIPKERFVNQQFMDVNDALAYANSVTPLQSGPRGQQTSVFTRGTNSSHTLALLNGMPINDQSTTNGSYDFGQDFLSNLTGIEVYRGAAAAHFGPSAIGGAVNFITDVVRENQVANTTAVGSGNSTVGNLFLEHDGWVAGLRGGRSAAKDASALAGAGEKDGVINNAGVLSLSKRIDSEWAFRSTLLGRFNQTDLDGHSRAQQVGYTSEQALMALQLGLDQKTTDYKNFFTLHSHKHDRQYFSPNNEHDQYASWNRTARAEHQRDGDGRFSWGLGVETKLDTAKFTNRGSYESSLNGSYSNHAIFGNIGYRFTDDWIGSLHLRGDNNSVIGRNDSLRMGLTKQNLLPDLTARASISQGFRSPSLYELYGRDNYGTQGNPSLRAEHSNGREIGLDYKLSNDFMLSTTYFTNKITGLIDYKDSTYVNTTGMATQQGTEISLSRHTDSGGLQVFATQLESLKANGQPQLRRPEHVLGANLYQRVTDDWSLFGNYKFFGQHLDINNDTYDNISMPETHMLDVGVGRRIWGSYSVNLSVKNLLDTQYQRPHGFQQPGRSFALTLSSSF